MSGTGGLIREQIGRIEAKLDGIIDRAGEMRTEMQAARTEAVKEREAIWSELRNIKHDARGEMQVLSMRMEKQEVSIEFLKQSLNKMEMPLQSVVSFQRRVSGIIAAAISAGSLLWVLRDPIWRAIVWTAKFVSGNS